MHIVIFSGGSGSKNLQTGLKKFSQDIHITNLINAYDDGKSTGIARRVMDVLGPSDIRKNQYTQYLNSGQKINQNIVEFYETRLDIPSDFSASFCQGYLEKWNLEFMSRYVDVFFGKAEEKGITDFSDFGMPNIIYAAMFAEVGYEMTISWFANWLNITDNVVLNSFDNVILQGITRNWTKLEDEGTIVDWNQRQDPIKKVSFKVPGEDIDQLNVTMNPHVKDILESADMVVFSSGTWWASQIPTLMTQGMREIVDSLKCPKVLVMNNEPDKDMIGLDNVEVLSVISDYMNLDDVDVLINGNADDSMSLDCVGAAHALMGNDHGKHDPDRLAFQVLSFYYGRESHNIFYFDFDDTIWSRDEAEKETSIENVKLLNKFSKKKEVVLVSGHAYKTIHGKLSEIYGRNLDPIEFDIWADGGIVKYKNNQITHFDKKYVVKGVNWIKGYAKTLGFEEDIDFRPNQFTPTCISFHGIDDRYRPLMKAFLEQMSMTHHLNNKVEIVGTTSVEIFHCATNKAVVLDSYRHKFPRSYYVGDEIDSGNDKEIAEICTKSVRVRDIRDTNILLKYLLEYYNESRY